MRDPRVELESLMLGVQMTALEMAHQVDPLEAVDLLAMRLALLHRRAMVLGEKMVAERAEMAGVNRPMVLTSYPGGGGGA